MNAKYFVPFAVALLLYGCASGYSQFYQMAPGATPEILATRRAGPPPAVPVVERGKPGNEQEVVEAYLKRGFVLIGSSLFNSGQEESDESAVRQAQKVGADLVLILNPKFTGSQTFNTPITTPTTSTSYSSGTATAYGPRGPVTAFGSGTTTTYGSTTSYVPITVNRSDYGAVYFVRQRFGLGVSTRDLNDSERQALQSNRGVAVRLVIDETPAYNADILAGDIIVAMDGVPITNARAFTDALATRGGRQVSLAIIRRGQPLEKVVRLNP